MTGDRPDPDDSIAGSIAEGAAFAGAPSQSELSATSVRASNKSGEVAAPLPKKYPVERKPGKKRPLSHFLLMGTVLLLVALAAALTTMRFAIHGREVIVPKLIGMKLRDAQLAAEGYGLSLVIEDHFYSSEVPEGGIVSQLPAAGSLVRRGWQIRAAQSLGMQGATVPSVVGQSPRVAEIIIRRSGMDLGEVATVHLPNALPDQVLAQDPPPDAKNLTSQKISLLIPANPEPKAYVMPYLLGRHFSDIRDEISQAGLKIGRVVDLSAPIAPPPPPPVFVPMGDHSTAEATGGSVFGGAAGAAPPAAPEEASAPRRAGASPDEINPLAVVVHQSPGPGQKVMANGSIFLDVVSQFPADKPEESKPEDVKPANVNPN